MLRDPIFAARGQPDGGSAADVRERRVAPMGKTIGYAIEGIGPGDHGAEFRWAAYRAAPGLGKTIGGNVNEAKFLCNRRGDSGSCRRRGRPGHHFGRAIQVWTCRPFRPQSIKAAAWSSKGASFRTARRSGIQLQIGQQARVDFAMQAGDIVETVEVVVQSPILQTEKRHPRNGTKYRRPIIGRRCAAGS